MQTTSQPQDSLIKLQQSPQLPSNQQTLHRKHYSSTGLLPPPKLLGTQFNQTYNLYRPQSTVILNRLKPFEKTLIPITWKSCQCPELEKQKQQQRSKFEKNSFIPAIHSTYYNKSYYNYLQKFSGQQHARLVEPKCMYTISKERVKSLEREKSPQIINKKQQQYDTKFMQQTKKIFGNSNFFYTGDNFQRADEMKQTEYRPQNIQQLRSCLYYDERTKSIPKTTIQNNIMEGIIREGSDILQNQNLVDQLFKLKNQKLIKSYQENTFNGKDGKVKFVYNDYHSMGSKGGYSRGALGTFYTR